MPVIEVPEVRSYYIWVWRDGLTQKYEGLMPITWEKAFELNPGLEYIREWVLNRWNHLNMFERHRSDWYVERADYS